MKKTAFSLTRKLVFLCLSAILFLSCASCGLASEKEERARWVPGEVIVTYRGSGAQNTLQQRASSADGGIAHIFGALSSASGNTVAVLRIPGKSTEELLKEFSADPNMISISPNYVIRLLLRTPNDPRFSEQWGLYNTGQSGGTGGADISAPQAWDLRTSALSDRVVAILDTGIAKNHEDLRANLWSGPGGSHGYDFVQNDDDPEDDHGHGTHVAGIIGAVGDNGSGVAGVAWNVKLMAVKMLDADGYGTSAMELAAYNWVLARKQAGVNIVAINASFGDSNPVQASKDAIETLGRNGILFIAAAGNDGANSDSTPSYPASYGLTNIISVAATDKNDRLTSYSNYGKNTVHLGAPGGDTGGGAGAILSTWTGYTPRAGDLFFDDMEQGKGNWITSAEGASQNLWDIIDTTRSGVPTKAWSDSPGRHYPHNQRTFLRLNRDIDLSGTSGESIMFGMQVRLDLESGSDFLVLQFSADGGATWRDMHSFTGGGDTWRAFITSVPPAFRTNRFRFGFRFESDSSNLIFRYAGVQIDDTGVGRAETSSYNRIAGTSMATPFVTGATALVASHFPNDGAATIRSRILNSVEKVDALRDKVSTGGRLDLYKALQTNSDIGDEDGVGGGCSLSSSPFALLLLLPLSVFPRRR